MSWAVFGGKPRVARPMGRGRNEVGKIVRGEKPIARGRRHQEVRKGPLNRKKTCEKSGAKNRGLLPAAPATSVAAHNIEDDGGNDKVKWKVGRDEVRNFLIDGAELWFGGDELQNPHKTQMHERVEAGYESSRPAIFRGARDGGEPDGGRKHNDDIEFRAVHEDAEGVLLHDADGHGEQEDEREKEDALEAGAILAGGAVDFREHQDKRAEADTGHSQGEQNVRRAEDFDVEAVGVVPPIVEGAGGDHGDGAPGADKGAEGSAETPHGDGVIAERRILLESRGKDYVAAGEAGNDSAQVDEHVRGSPESVAADALVPGNVPDAADDAGGDGDDVAPDVPGDGESFGGDALGGLGLEC